MDDVLDSVFGRLGELVHEGGKEQVTLSLPPRPEYVSTARMVASAFARHHFFSETQVDDLRIAVSEAMTNAMRAHREAGIEDALTMIATMEGETMTLEVIDRGNGFDLHGDGPPEQTPVPGTFEGGLGLTLIRSLFSEISFERPAGGGMRLTIWVKREADPLEPLR